jgi:transmembrane sensor
MKQMTTEQFRLAEEAALWILRMERNPTRQTREEFSNWLRESPRHTEEFLFAKSVSVQFDGVDPRHEIEIEPAVLATLKENEREVEALFVPPTASAQPRIGLRLIAWAAAVAGILVAGAIVVTELDQTPTYVTSTGDQRSVKLPDGSLMQLNTNSRAEVAYTKTTRQIRLLQGEALFSVMKDAQRPFDVVAGGTTIKAVGTQFNVYRRNEATRISVVEGTVEIMQAPENRTAALPEVLVLQAGSEADATPVRLAKTANPDIAHALAWRARRLEFHGDRLADVAREFNRYNKVQIRIEGDRIADRQISGAFDADDTRPLLEFLANDPAFVISNGAGEIVVSQK